MFALKPFATGIALSCAAILPAAAATLPAADIQTFDRGVRDAQISSLYSSTVEDFEVFGAGELSGALRTSVGVFSTIGGTGSGGTVTHTSGNTGSDLYVRDKPVYGRINTTTGGSNFLDSNDTSGVDWTISGFGLFDRIFFTLSDIADTGADFLLTAGGDSIMSVSEKRPNGAVDMIMLSFETAIDELTLTFSHDRLNDGFGIDDAGFGLSTPGMSNPPSAVPLPTSIAFLLAGTAALAGLRQHGRRKES